MATGSLYGSTSESTGLYGIGAASGGTYFEWFVFQDSATAPPTPTGGSWNFSNNTGTPPTGWVVSPPPAPVNQVWVSIVVVDSRNVTTLSWSVPGLMTGSGLPILSASGVPASGTGLNGQLYINTATTPQSLYFKQSGAWTQLSGSNLVDLVNNQTIGGVKTFTQTIQGDISGTAGNVSGVVAVANGGTGASTAANARTNLGLGSIATQDANAVAITGGLITGITDLAVADGGTGASSASVARTNLGAVGLSDTQTLTNKTISGASNTLTNIPNSALDNDSVNVNGVDLTLGAVQTLGPNWILPSYAGNAGKVLAVNPSSSDVQWIAGGGVGSVTSVDVSGGTTGLTTSGGPITAAGVITLAGTLAVANGGTGVTTSTGTGSTVLSTSPALTTPSINLINDTNGNEILSLSPVASATDYLTVKNGIGVGVPLHIQADGPSANIGLHIQPKGTGLVTITDGTDFNKGIRFRSSSSAAGVTTLIDAVSSAGHVVTLPDANTTLVGRNTTDTLTNKTFGDNPTFSAGVASGVAYLNGSKVLTTGSALTFTNPSTFVTRFNVGSLVGTAAYRGGIEVEENSASFRLYGPSDYKILETDGFSTPSNIKFYANNSEQMRLTSTGLGIGTSSPDAKLDVTSVGTASTYTVTAVIQDGNYPASGNPTLEFNGFIGGNGYRSGIGSIGGQQLAFYTPSTFGVAPTRQMTLNESGNLGIGTSSPTERLHVAGALRVTGAQTTAGTGVYLEQTSGTGGVSVYGPDNSTQGTFRIYTATANGGTGSTKLTIDSSGNLGLGVTPSAWSGEIAFQVGRASIAFNTTYGTTSISANQYGSATGRRYIASEYALQYDQQANTGAHAWFTAPSGTAGNAISFSQVMTLDASGNLLVGTTSGSGRIRMKQSADAFSGAFNIENFGNTNAWAFLIGSDNNLYTGYNGTGLGVFNNSTGAYTTISDRSLKKNIAEIQYGLNSVLALRPVSYLMKDQEEGASKTLGFIAQEVDEVVPESVFLMREDLYGMDKEALIPVLVKAMQEQQAIITALTARVAALESN